MTEEKIKKLGSIEKEFVHNLVYEGYTREEAYVLAIGEQDMINDENRQKYRNRANNMFCREEVAEYYWELMYEVREKMANKAAWTKERSTEILTRLIEKTNKVMEDTGKVTLNAINGIVLPVKELNAMYGLNTPSLNVNVDGLVKFVGEDQIKE